MKTKLIVLRTLTILILFNINIEHVKCVSPDSTTISFSTSSEIHWEDPSYVQGDTYTVNVYSGGILYYSAVTCTHTVTVPFSQTLTNDVKIELIKHKTGDYTFLKILSIVTIEDDSYRQTIFL